MFWIALEMSNSRAALFTGLQILVKGQPLKVKFEVEAKSGNTARDGDCLSLLPLQHLRQWESYFFVHVWQTCSINYKLNPTELLLFLSMCLWRPTALVNNLKQKQLTNYHSRCRCRLRLKTDRTSCVKRKASRTGNRLRRAVSIGSENHDLMGIALSATKKNSNPPLTYFRTCCSGKVKFSPAVFRHSKVKLAEA